MTETERLYVCDLLTMDEIAKLAGITRQGVKKRLDVAGVTYRGGKINQLCQHCGTNFKASRTRVKQGKAQYCSQLCFHAARNILDYQCWREGQRRARSIMNAKQGEVVHHIDGNNHNNKSDNLQVFKSQSDHMKYHHSLRY